MDLRRLKTVFIFVLIGINIMLAAVLYSAKNYKSEEKKIMVENLTYLLSKNMIFIPETTEIPDSPDICSFYLEKMFGSDEEMLVKFLGEDYIFKGDVYKNGGNLLRITGDEFTFLRETPVGEISDLTPENIEKLCRTEMENLGIMADVYAFGGINYVGERIKAIFTVRQEDMEFFDAYISFDVSMDGILGVSGKNIVSKIKASDSNTPYYSVISILADLVKSQELEKNAAHTIVSIRPGYYIGKSEESYRNILAIPVWQIATDRGHILHYDARNGQKINE
ncbi:MAG: hypothetical protein J6D15_04815 [Clostridia bacterium]|nr:hypothetical protein [Clostridia bacterium]